ncbi:MAG TPA: SPFH domain-containing protein, partial [Stellaceae bacterium]|nr:SPFH domain-containing protein [Stellaceae bacterium]
MNRRTLAITAAVLVVLGIFAMSALFTVAQTQQALLLQFGKPQRVIRGPGLHVKWPFIQEAVLFDT